MNCPRKCVIIGHSHAAFLRNAAKAINGGLPDVMFSFCLLQNHKVEEAELTQSGAGAPTRQDIVAHQRQRIAALIGQEKPDIIVSILLGNTHNIWCLPQHPRRFDFIVPGREHLPFIEGAEIIPYGAMKLALDRVISRELLPIVEAISAEAPGVPHYFLPPPPPVRSSDFLLNETKEFAGEFHRLGVSPPHLRLKFWHLNLDLPKQYAGKCGTRMFDLPGGAFDEDGFLPESFWVDATHGNVAYNKMILTRLAALRSREPAV